jgi:methylenetetrahydrofolate dehydrogenase (NADP+)/methenyltetrahydrofolate cyclohydrolase
MKGNACRRVGMESRPIVLPAHTTTAELFHIIDELNREPRVRGILLQHPTPLHIDERACFDRISIEKDVDGVTTHGFGRMAMKQAAFGSATPAGVMRLLRHYEVPIQGKHAVIVGRSPILGRPMAMMLLVANATITLCHRFTQGLPELLKPADIVVAALGKREYIRAEWIKDGAVIIDAGYHPNPPGANGEKSTGGTGDVELAPLIDRCSAYTPVPGGVGPMTIATLMAQTVESAERAAGVSSNHLVRV